MLTIATMAIGTVALLVALGIVLCGIAEALGVSCR